MIVKIRQTIHLVILMLFLVGCSRAIAKENAALPTATPARREQAVDPTVEPGGDEAQALVAQAVADLRGRLEGRAEIAVQSVMPTDFSDASLGVPEPGVLYAQVLTPGYVIRLTVGDQAYVYHGSGERVVLAAGEAKQVISVPAGQSVPPVSGEVTFSRVEIADTGLSIEVPNGWLWLEPEWAWTPAEESDLLLGVTWTDLQPPTEPEAAMLPHPSQILYSEDLALSWAQGRRFLAEVYGPAAQGDGAKAPVESVEIHVLAVVRHDGTRRAFDLYVRGASMEDMGALEPVLQRALDTSALEGGGSQIDEPSPVASEGQGSEAGWQTLADGVYGFQLLIPQDWTWKELPATGPGVPEDWPMTRIVHLFPQAWEADLSRSGPPDPTAKPVVAPLQVEVVVGPAEQFRRVYPEPTQSETIEINGLQVTVEREVFDPMWLARYVFQDPDNPEVWVVVGDYLSGFPDRVEGNEALVKVLPAIVATFEFVR